MNGEVKKCLLCLRNASNFKIFVCENCNLCCDGRTSDERESLAINHDGHQHHPRTDDICKKHDLEKSQLYCNTCNVIVDHQEHTYRRESSRNVMENMDKLTEDDPKKQPGLGNINGSQSQQQTPPLFCLDDHYSKNSRQKTDLQSAIDEVNQSIEIARDMLNKGTTHERIKNHEWRIVSDTTSSVTLVTPDVIPTNGDYINHVDDFEHSLHSLGNVPLQDDVINMSLLNQDDTSVNSFIPEKFTISHVMSLGMQGEFEEPVGVTTSTTDGSIFVADHAYDRIVVFDKYGQFVRTMTHVSTGSGRECAFLCPAGLATDSLSGNIVIAERGRHRITVMSTHGKLQHKFGKMGKAQGHLRDPLGVSVDSRGRIIVADTANSRIQVFDKHGDLIFVFGHEGDLDYPNYAVYHQGLFIVSDTDNDSVKIFDKQGRYVRSLTDHKEGLFSAPSGLAVFKHDYILVCDFNNDCVKMFTLDGQFVTKFGSEGSGPGYFSGPEAVTVTSDNRIIVTDKNNSRVQIFELITAA